MKPLMSRQVTRENKGDVEWERAESHLTDAGRNEFMARQMKRMADAKKAREESAKAKVQPIGKRIMKASI